MTRKQRNAIGEGVAAAWAGKSRYKRKQWAANISKGLKRSWRKRR